MNESIRILIVEDLPTDAELAEREINKALQSCVFQRVETREDYLAALVTFQPDLIVSDYKMPHFDGLTALKLALEHAPLIPLIILTGAINEDTAVECMKAGATDYVIKEHIKRLGSAVIHALEEKQLRQERRRAEEALRESEERFRNLYENATIGLYRTTPEGRIVMANPAAVRMLGYSSFDELAQRDLEKEGFDTTLLRSEFRQRLESEGVVTSLESAWIRKDGSTIFVRESAKAVRDEVGKVLYYDGTFEDITERKRAEEERTKLEVQLHQAQKMESIGRLAGGIAHDFNNMLTVINGYTELLLQCHLDNSERQRKDLEQIYRAGQRAADLTRQLLAFSRQQVLQPEVLNLNDVIINIEKMLRRLIGEDIDLQTRLTPQLGSIKADKGQIEQVIMNLVVNARDAMPEGGKLTIETTNVYLDEAYARQHGDVSPGPYIMVAISDTGLGMDAQTQARIFEPFFTTKERDKGTGLGLAMVYGTVSQSGGYIWVYSEVGQGTTFKIYLPQLAEVVEAVEPKQIPANLTGGSETILLVEDDELVRLLVRQTLLDSGYTVLETGNGEQARQVCSEHQGPIHLMLTDVVMPGGLNGPQLAKELTSLCPQLKVLFMSGYTDNAIAHYGVLDPAIAFLPKPFTPVDLLRKVREVLEVEKSESSIL